MRPHQRRVCSAIQAVMRRVQISAKSAVAIPRRAHSAPAPAMRPAVTCRA
ncbi:hypothetical protein [Nonomuraea zeae]|nr:hypothetical protein [Nonomuraea zeae]